LHAVLALPKFVEVEQRLPDPTAQETGAHRRFRLVEDGDETVPAVAAAALGQLQVAPGLSVEGHEVIESVGMQARDLAEAREPRVLKILQQPTGGADGEREAGAAVAIQRLDLEVTAEGLGGAVLAPLPGVSLRDTATGRERLAEPRRWFKAGCPIGEAPGR